MSRRWLFALLPVYLSAAAQDVSHGQLLYENHCIVCHRESLHERQNSKVASYADLRYQVERWTNEAARKFTPSEREDLIEFLDATYYRLYLNQGRDRKL